MSKILILRFPKSLNPEQLKESYVQTQKLLGTNYIVLPFVADVEKVEAEIVYDPHFNGYQLEGSLNPDAEKRLSQEIAREFLQVDTSTNAYMGKNKPND